jgi:hypothetical protein
LLVQPRFNRFSLVLFVLVHLSAFLFPVAVGS